jgi:predicted dienelactone hydrolase
MKYILFLGIFLTLVACSFSRESHSELPLSETAAADGPLRVQTLAFPKLVDNDRKRSIPIKVHLPTSGGPYPLIVVSHGAGGTWDANYAQAHHLASHGYVVFALEHVGSNLAVAKANIHFLRNIKAMTRDASEVLGRPKDISFAIDQAERWNASDEKLRGRIDLAHIGLLGHSFGAYTTLAVTGIRPALDWLKPVVPPGHGLGPNLRDPRIDCGVALSPQGPGEPFFIEQSYASLRTPLLGISGSRDKQQGAEPENRRRAFTLWPPGDKYFIWLEGADHTAFSDSTGAGLRMLPSRSRDDVQPIVRAATLAFFDAYLKGKKEALQGLSVKALTPYLHGEVDNIEVLTK